MATTQAIAAVCEAVVKLLQVNYRPDEFDTNLEFKVYTTQDFQNPMEAGVSLFLYRIYHNGNIRHPAGRIRADGGKQRSRFPVDCAFILTTWAREASLQNSIAGWMMRVIEDTPLLNSGILNATWNNVFGQAENIELVLGDLTNEDMFKIWDALIQNSYRLSVPYLARSIWIESHESVVEDNPAVRERRYLYHVPYEIDDVG